MANSDDTSKPTRARRNQPKVTAEPPPGAAPPAANTPPTPSLTLEEAIESERTMLLQIRSMLHCLHEVLLYADDDDSIMHAEVAQTAARLINDTCVRLDFVNLRPLIEALQNRVSVAPRDDEPDFSPPGSYQVREPTPVYLA